VLLFAICHLRIAASNILTFPRFPHYDLQVKMHANRFSYVFTYRYFFRSSGVADGV